MDRPRDQLFSRPCFASDQDRGIGRRYPANLVQYREQRGRASNDLLEIVDRLELFLEIEILLLETGAVGLGDHAVRDVNPDGMDCLNTPVCSTRRSHPEVDPQRATVPPSHLQLQCRHFLTGETCVECFFGLCSTRGCLAEVLQNA